MAEFLSLKLPDTSILESHLDQFYSHVSELPLNSEHTNLLTTSRDAYNASNPDPNLCRNVDCLNGNIVSESESDNPEDYVGLSSVSTECTKKIITKKRMSLAQRNRRLKAKKIAERNFLCR